jgi:hypothetical protein
LREKEKTHTGDDWFTHLTKTLGKEGMGEVGIIVFFLIGIALLFFVTPRV